MHDTTKKHRGPKHYKHNYAFFGDRSFDCGEKKDKKLNAQVYNKKVFGFVWRYILWGLIVLVELDLQVHQFSQNNLSLQNISPCKSNK